MSEVFLTKEGYDNLTKRLEYLLGTARKEISEKIKTAREFGDLSENAEYDAAKEEQAFIETEIKEIDDKLRRAVIIDAGAIDTSKVTIGVTVKLYDTEFDEEIEYKIVGTTEADAKSGKISNESPLGKALLGKAVGEVAEVVSPQGKINFKVLSIRA